MSMSRKDFALVADIIRNLPPTATREQVAERFATGLKPSNAHFNAELFTKACDPKAGRS